MRQAIAAATAVAMLAGGSAALAHHSFAVFFDPDKMVTIRGTVTAFAFRNPHGIVQIDVPKGGKIEHWAAETNAPVVLQRRGWTRTSLKAGDVVTIEGWPARDGKPYLRLLKATRADGSVIGTPFSPNDD